MFGDLSNIDFAAIDQANNPSLEYEAAKAIQLAKRGTTAIVILQAVAAFSALTLAVITWKTYHEGKRRRSTKRFTRSNRGGRMRMRRRVRR